MSYRAKLQASFFVLGVLAIAVTAWQATEGAVAALRRSTTDHLTAVRETKRRLIENYFSDLSGHVLALSSDESGVSALEAFRAAWDALPVANSDDAADLKAHYRETLSAGVASGQLTAAQAEHDWFPDEPRTIALQRQFITANPHPVGAKDLWLQPTGLGAYGAAHARYHPTLHRYQGVFGFYDVFLIDARDGRILYTVFKEIDLGRRLTQAPFAGTALARAFTRALAVPDASTAVIEDYAPYAPSHFAPAAFVAAPIWRAGEKIGVLAIQVSIDRINRVMTSDRNWSGEGLGRTGHTFIVAADGTLRSDVRAELEDPEAFLQAVRSAGATAETVAGIRRNRTAILTLSLPESVAASFHAAPAGTTIGTDIRGHDVIRSHARLNLPGLQWFLVAEMETAEAFAPARALLWRLLTIGGLVTIAFLAAAWLLARSVTRPVLALVAGTRALTTRDFKVRLPVDSHDELGQLAESFNEMAERLEQTTVSRDELDRANQQLMLHQVELQSLNARLIDAQEQERRRIARELHDDLSQRLAGVAITIGALSKAQPDGSDQQIALRTIHANLAKIAGDVHRLSRRLHPATLDDLGLVAAVETECRSLFELGGPPVVFSHHGSFEDLHPDVELAIYRITQESLRNILTHAHASEVTVRLDAGDDEIVLEIRDDGRGYDSKSAGFRAGLGLSSMAERARLLDGTLTTMSTPGEGTVVTARVPREGQR